MTTLAIIAGAFVGAVIGTVLGRVIGALLWDWWERFRLTRPAIMATIEESYDEALRQGCHGSGEWCDRCWPHRWGRPEPAPIGPAPVPEWLREHDEAYPPDRTTSPPAASTPSPRGSGRAQPASSQWAGLGSALAILGVSVARVLLWSAVIVAIAWLLTQWVMS